MEFGIEWQPLFGYTLFPARPPIQSEDKTWKENQHRGLERMDLVKVSPAAQNSFEASSRAIVALPTAFLSVAEPTANAC